jgi:ribosome-associated protein
VAEAGARDPGGPTAERAGERAGDRAGERGRLRVNATCVIRLDELEWRTTGSGGPGGQHANTSDTRVEVRFPIASSTSLAPRQKERLLEQFGPVARATASDSRSQARNREVALERLRSRLADALHLDPPRRSTKPTRSAKQSRLDAKRRQSVRKQDRRRPSGED